MSPFLGVSAIHFVYTQIMEEKAENEHGDEKILQGMQLRLQSLLEWDNSRF